MPMSRFIEMLTEYFGKENILNRDTDLVTSEYFIDLFESVLIHVSKNQSEKKLIHFKNMALLPFVWVEKNKKNVIKGFENSVSAIHLVFLFV